MSLPFAPRKWQTVFKHASIVVGDGRVIMYYNFHYTVI